MRSVRLIAFKFAVAVSALAGILAVAPAVASADAVSDLYGAEYDRVAVLEAGDDSFEPEAAVADDVAADGTDAGVALLDAGQVARPLSPRDVSPEMLYFCKWESGQNYDQGLSWGDGYHAMGYFQFDNRYDLGSFLYSVYCYNSTKYSALKVIGDKYEWNVNRDTRKDGDFTEFGKDLNTAWHACYKADPTEFSNLQNDWAYTQYYDSSDGIRGSLLELGINIDDRTDCVKSLVWGMANLFGKGGGKYEIRNGNYWGAIWFIKNSGINGSMDDETLVTTLCDYVINNVARRYPSQPQYHQGWQNRYRDEKAHYLAVIKETAATNRKTLDALAATNRATVADGMYVIRALCSSRGVLDVARASTSNGANVCIWDADGSDSQRWIISHDSAGYITLTNAASGKVLDAAGDAGKEGDNAQQWTPNGGWNQKWIAVSDSTGGVMLVSAMRSNLVLDVYRGLSDSGTNVQLWSSNGGVSQSFKFEAAKTQRQTLDDLAAENRDAIADGTYVVRALCSDRGVLDVYGGYTDNGRNVQIWTSNSTDGQRWAVTHDDAGYVTLTNAASGKVLDVAWGVGREGDNVDQWSANGGWNQKWVAVPDSHGGVTLVSAIRPDRVLDVYYGRSEAGTNVQLWSSNGGVSQSFKFEAAKTQRQTLDDLAAENRDAIADGTYVVRALCSDRGVLDVYGGYTDNGRNVQIWTSNSTDGQRWAVTHDDAGYVTLTNAASGKVLDVAWGVGREGDNVDQWSANGGWNQKWVAVPDSHGGVTLVSAIRPDRVLDVYYGRSEAGTNVQLWSSNGGVSQSFNFIKAYPSVPTSDEGVVDENAWYDIVPECAPDKALDIYGASRVTGANVDTWNANGTVGQAFRFEFHDGYYLIINAGSGLALDVANSDVIPGGNVSQWPSDATRANRLFSIRSNGDGTVSLVNKATGLAVNVSGGSSAAGTNVDVWTPDGSSAQRYRLVKRDRLVSAGTYTISLATDSSLALDLANSSPNDNASILAWRSSGALNQRWLITPVDGQSNDVYAIESLSSSKRLTADGNGVAQGAAKDDSTQWWRIVVDSGAISFESVSNPGMRLSVDASFGANAGLSSASSAVSQRFALMPTDGMLPSGTYYIRAASAPSQVIDVERGSMADCANVLAWANNGGGNQKWNITCNSDGTYTFNNCATGKVLDVENGVAAPGTNVLQYTANGGKNQRWNMTYREGGYVISSALDSSLILTFSGGTASGSNACVDVDSGSAGQRFTFGPTTYLPPAEQAMTLKAQGYHSSTSWLILVDITQNRVGIFNGSMGNWKLQNFWLCSSGAPNSPTRVGQFTVGNKGYSFGEEHGYSCYYWTQFYADYLFHSVKYYAGTRNIMDGRLGMNISAGCVRMQIDQAKWIYDNIPRGTKVVVYR